MKTDGPSSGTLREVQIPVVTQESCKESYKGFRTVNVDDSVLCAGLARGGKDACQVNILKSIIVYSNYYQNSIPFFFLKGRFWRATYDTRKRTILSVGNCKFWIQMCRAWLPWRLYKNVSFSRLDFIKNVIARFNFLQNNFLFY